MKKLAKLAGTLPFAHLLGVKAGRAEEDKSTDDEDKDKAKKAKAEDDESDDQAKKAKAEEDDSDKKPEDEESPKGKKAKAESDEPDEDDEDEKDKAKAKAARLSERARCAAIMAHGIKAGAVRQAGVLAFSSDMDAELAIASLDASAADHDKPASTLASRMQTVQQIPVRPDGGAAAAEGHAAVTNAILAAASKARGKA